MAFRAIVLLLVLGLPRLVAGGDEGEIGKLVADLGHDVPAVREEASRTIVFYRDRAVPALTAALQSPDTEVRVRAQQALDAIALDKQIGPSAWVRLPEGESSVEALLREVARQGGRSFDRGDVVLDGKTYAGPCGWMPIWEGIDRLTRAADCRYAMPFDMRIGLASGQAPKSVFQHAGPMRFEAIGVLTRNGALGSDDAGLGIQVDWEPHVDPIVEWLPPSLDLLNSKGVLLDSYRPKTGSWFAWCRQYARYSAGSGHGVRLFVPIAGDGAQAGCRLQGHLRVLFVQEIDEVLISLSERERAEYRVHGHSLAVRGCTIGAELVAIPLSWGWDQVDPPTGIVEEGYDRDLRGFSDMVLRASNSQESELTWPSAVMTSGGRSHGSLSSVPAGPPPYQLVVRTVTRVVTSWVALDLQDIDLR